jgi:hypothetical protein
MKKSGKSLEENMLKRGDYTVRKVAKTNCPCCKGNSAENFLIPCDCVRKIFTYHQKDTNNAP